MNVSDRYLEQALEELEELRNENKELKRVVSIYQELVEQIKDELKKWRETDYEES